MKTQLRREAASALLGIKGPRTTGRRLEWTPAVAQREVLKASKRVVRLQLKRRQLRRALALLNEDITIARRELKAVMGAVIRDDEL